MNEKMSEKSKEEKKEQIVERFENNKKPSKIEVIKASKMPDWQKQKLIEELEGSKEDLTGKIPFAVYAKIKKLGSSMQKAMLAYHGAKSIRLATLAEWDEIFKSF